MLRSRSPIGILFFFFTCLTVSHALPESDLAVPDVPLSVKPLDLSAVPSNRQIMAAGQLGGQLYPTGRIEDKILEGTINRSFGGAIDLWNRHAYREAVVLFRKHIEEFPGSPWAAEAVLHIGCDAYYNGRYGEAEESFRWIINSFEGSRHEGAKLILDKAVLRLANLRVAQNRPGEARKLFQGLKKTARGWRERTYASHWLRRLSSQKGRELAMLNCGTKALSRLLEQKERLAEARQVAEMLPDTLLGHSMKDLSGIAGQFGYHLQAVRLLPREISLLTLPAIVHTGRNGDNEGGHYWILEKVTETSLLLFDPQAGRRFQQSPEEFEKEWTGTALVFSDGRDALPGLLLSETESGQIYGGCCGVPRPEGGLGDPCKGSGGGSSASGGGPSGAPSAGSCPGSSKGSPVWTVNMITMNLYMQDTPLWYETFVGPPLQIQLSYNSQSAIAHNEPFGNKWQFNYGSYLVVDTIGVVTIFMPDGSRDSYAPDGGGGYTRPYHGYNTLSKLAENHFELKFPEGAVYVYRIPAGTASLQPFLVEMRDARGKKLTMTYNAAVRLTAITDALGKKTTLTYNASGLVTKVTDPFGRFATFAYDANRNLTKITDMGGYSTIIGYDADVYPKSIQTGTDKRTFYVEPADGLDNSSNIYPPPGGAMWDDYRITVTDPSGGKEEYYYDGYHGSSWYVSPRHYVPYESHAVNNYGSSAPKMTYRFVKTTGLIGEISAITTAAGLSYAFTYDANGNMLSVTDPHGNKTTYTYNSMGKVLTVTDPNLTVTTTAYAPNGVDPVSVTDGRGTVTTSYNAFHELTSVTNRLGNTKTFTYNTYGQRATETDELGAVTTYAYNTAHQLSGITKAGKTLAAFTYDTAGRPRTSTDASGRVLTYDYNNLDEVTMITYPDAKSETFSYSASIPHLVTAYTGRSGLTTAYTYDALKRLVGTTDPAGRTAAFVRDANGNVTQLVDHYGGIVTFAYDRDDRLVRKTYADGNTETYTFDYDQLYRVTGARGYYATYSYDKNVNLKFVSYSGAGTPSVTYQYDAYSRLTAMTDVRGASAFTYDAESNLLSMDGPLINDTMTFTYDAKGRMTGYSLSGGQPVTFSYDALDRMTGLQKGADAYTYTFAGAGGLVQKLTRPNGSSVLYGRDSLKRLSAVTHQDSSNTVIRKYAFTRDAKDNRVTEVVTGASSVVFPNEEASGYTYNAMSQLLSSTGPDRSYTYDSDGNQLTGYTPQGYAFTASHDAANRLISLQYTDGAAVLRKTEYLYDGFGFLARKKEYANAALTDDTFYVRLGPFVFQERGANNAVKREYLWGLGMGGGIGGLLSLTQGGQDYVYLHDGRGNVTALLNAAQAVAAEYTYDPFGLLLSKTGTADQPYRFSTKDYDEKTGLLYFGYRFYSPLTGRWVSRDPVGEAGGMNLYGYTGNNPVDRIDPLGLSCPDDDDDDWTKKIPKKPPKIPKKPKPLKEYEQRLKEAEKNKEPTWDLFKKIKNLFDSSNDSLAGG